MFKRIARAVIPNLPHLRWRTATEFARFRIEAVPLGWPTALQLSWERCRPTSRRGRIRSIRLPGYRFPLFYRAGTSDADVIHQVFVRREYECAARLPGIEFIVDCGANIGTSAFYLLHRYPGARVVVVEPDPGNMAVCRRNLAPFGKQVTFVQAGVWSSTGPLVVERGQFGDGAEWSFQVRPAQSGEPDQISAFTIADLMAAGGFARIDLLKVDIEAAEKEVFGPGSQEWLQLTRNLVIELHGPECERVVAAALSGFVSGIAHCGELTLYGNITPRDGSPCS
ncbi:MAG TPA: FkbM family methyltransferase [Gemmata sp.]|nr:FkbM family methyltransferase [Gemmata sp.]